MANDDDNESPDLRRIFKTPQVLARYTLDNADYLSHIARVVKNSEKLQEKIGAKLESVAADPDTLDYVVLTYLAAHYIREGESMPRWMRRFAADALTGAITPRPRKGRKKTGLQRDFALWAAVETVSDIFGMGKYSAGSETRKTAADIVMEVSGESRDVVLHAIRNHADFAPPVLRAKKPS